MEDMQIDDSQLNAAFDMARDDLLLYTKLCNPSYIISTVHVAIAQRLQRAVARKTRRLIISCPPQHGKAIEDREPLLTANRGWIPMGTVQQWDVVFAEDGTPTKVVAVAHWSERPLYQITTDDRMTLVVDAAHTWKVRMDRKRPNSFTIWSTELLAKRTSNRAPMLPRTGAVQFPASETLTIDPYLLGLWLGDGSSGAGEITVGQKDQEWMQEQFFLRGHPLRHRTDTMSFGISNGFQVALRGLGVINNKHIPGCYLRSSVADRILLVQGIVDTDGHVAPDGQVELCGVNKRLILDAQMLLHSLGIKATIINGDATIYGRYICPKYRLMFYCSFAAMMPRKRCRLVQAKKDCRYLQRIETHGVGNTTCIRIDHPSHVFLAGTGLIPTHNSLLSCVEMPTWALGRNPKENLVVASYSQDLAERSSKAARSRIKDSEVYREIFNTSISENDASQASWATSDGGRYKAVGIGGSLTGHPASILIVDDPIKDFKEAHSPMTRENVWNWFTSVALTRLAPDAVVIIIMTRWSTDDLVGRLLNPERVANLKSSGVEGMDEWEVLNLAAIAEVNDPIGRQPGEALFPERYNLDWLSATRATVGSYVWTALYEGRPTIKGGNYIPIEKFRIVERPAMGLTWYRFWDLATTANAKNDYTAGIAGAVDPADGVLYLRDCVFKQMDWPESRERIASIADAERIPVGIEAVGGFKTGYQNLLEVMPSYISCREYGADRDKLLRALPWIAMVEKGKVALVRGAWNVDFIMQAEAFPGGVHDDICDAVSGVVLMIKTSSQLPIPYTRAYQDRFSRALASRRDRHLVG